MATESELQWLRLRHEANAVRLESAIDAIRLRGIEPLLIKGYAAAANYPDPSTRPYSDVDLCVAPEDYHRAKSVIRELNLGIGIDLHRGLRHLHSVPYATVFNRSTTLGVGNTSIRIPDPQDHLVILGTHWLNDGGARLHRLDDVRYLVERFSGLDWNRIKRELPPNRWRWLTVTLGAAVKYRGLTLDHASLTVPELEIPAWMDEALVSEWGSTPIEPLYYAKGDWRRFLTQLRRRFPPNALESVVECDGDIDVGNIRWYQIRSFVSRIPRALYLQITVRSE